MDPSIGISIEWVFGIFIKPTIGILMEPSIGTLLDPSIGIMMEPSIRISGVGFVWREPLPLSQILEEGENSARCGKKFTAYLIQILICISRTLMKSLHLSKLYEVFSPVVTMTLM